MRASKRRMTGRRKDARGLTYRHAWTGPVVPLGGHPDASVLFFEPSDASPHVVDHVVLQAHARRLREDPRLHLEVVGHANRGSSPEAVRALALERAENVRRLLVRFGARAAQIDAQTRADTQPAGDAATARGRALNRRVHLRWLEPESVRAWAPRPAMEQRAAA